MPYSYVSRDNLKLSLVDTASTDDAIYRRVLEGVSQAIDNWTNRTYRIYLATMYYTADDDELNINDLISITTLKTDPNNNRTYGTTFAITDYDLLDYNAPNERAPYTKLALAPTGTNYFPTNKRGVQIAGKFGYFEDLETIASLLAEDLDISETGVDVTAGTDFDVLDTILINDEQMYITAISTNTLTVERGVNGTTKATHSNGATIYRYRYPGPIVEACIIQAARIFRRKDAPFGVVGTPEIGMVRIVSLDPDVKQMIAPYKRLVVGAI